MNDNQIPLDFINNIIQGDNIDLIKKIPDNSINCIITSPPYYQQRDYGLGWGTDETIIEYINKLIKLFEQCIRVLKKDGHILYNLGDKYIKSNLGLIPYRFAIKVKEVFPELILINNVTWVKKNPTPRQFKRRLVSATEPFFDFVKTKKYYYNREAFLMDKERNKKNHKIVVSPDKGKHYINLIKESEILTDKQKENALKDIDMMLNEMAEGEITDFRMKIKGIHKAAYGGHEGGRKTQIEQNGYTMIRMYGKKMKKDAVIFPKETVSFSKHPAMYPKDLIKEFLLLLSREGDIILDPYMGSGTTALACKETNRKFIGFEINPEYCKEARKRLGFKKDTNNGKNIDNGQKSILTYTD
ncbi:MAG: DNA-methyltransferase [Candidatus Hermodarchaeota archaeon]